MHQPLVLLAFAIVAAAIAGMAVASWRTAGRKVDALAYLPPSPAELPPTDAERAELVTVITAAGKRGASIPDIAADVLAAGYRKQEGR